MRPSHVYLVVIRISFDSPSALRHAGRRGAGGLHAVQLPRRLTRFMLVQSACVPRRSALTARQVAAETGRRNGRI